MSHDEQPTILEIRGQEYKKWGYDWYITDALELAPASWTYEEIVQLRNAIRENYQHGHDIPTHPLKDNSAALKAFIQTILAIDPAATI